MSDLCNVGSQKWTVRRTHAGWIADNFKRRRSHCSKIVQQFSHAVGMLSAKIYGLRVTGGHGCSTGGAGKAAGYIFDVNVVAFGFERLPSCSLVRPAFNCATISGKTCGLVSPGPITLNSLMITPRTCVAARSNAHTVHLATSSNHKRRRDLLVICARDVDLLRVDTRHLSWRTPSDSRPV